MEYFEEKHLKDLKRRVKHALSSLSKSSDDVLFYQENLKCKTGVYNVVLREEYYDPSKLPEVEDIIVYTNRIHEAVKLLSELERECNGLEQVLRRHMDYIRKVEYARLKDEGVTWTEYKKKYLNL